MSDGCIHNYNYLLSNEFVYGIIPIFNTYGFPVLTIPLVTCTAR
jgi:hypothetical protein